MDNNTPTATAPAIELGQSTKSDNTPDQTLAHAPSERYPSGARFILLTIGLILSIFLAALDASIISTAIPSITDHFGTVKDVGWYGSAYSITVSSFTKALLL